MITDIPVLVALSQLRVRHKKRHKKNIRAENLCQMMLRISVKQSRDYLE